MKSAAAEPSTSSPPPSPPCQPRPFSAPSVTRGLLPGVPHAGRRRLLQLRYLAWRIPPVSLSPQGTRTRLALTSSCPPQDNLMTAPSGSSSSGSSGNWLSKNREHGKASAAPSLRMILLWDADCGLAQLDRQSFAKMLAEK